MQGNTYIRTHKRSTGDMFSLLMRIIVNLKRGNYEGDGFADKGESVWF